MRGPLASKPMTLPTSRLPNTNVTALVLSVLYEWQPMRFGTGLEVHKYTLSKPHDEQLAMQLLLHTGFDQ